MSQQAVGRQFECATCGTKIIVVKASATEIACCGARMEPVQTPASRQGS